MASIKYLLFLFTFISFSLIFSGEAHAASGSGGHSVGGGIIVMTPSQDDLDASIAVINSAPASVSKFGTAYEYNVFYQYRFSGTMFALQFRPSIFTQSTSGSGYKFSLSGFTFFPMVKLYALENTFIHFFLQTGIGYGSLSGKMTNSTDAVEWSGSAFGAMGGMGAEFCFTPAQCMVVEGNLRYLPIQRNVVSSSNNAASTGFTQTAANQELEANNSDVKTTLSGIQGGLSYIYNF